MSSSSSEEYSEYTYIYHSDDDADDTYSITQLLSFRIWCILTLVWLFAVGICVFQLKQLEQSNESQQMIYYESLERDIEEERRRNIKAAARLRLDPKKRRRMIALSIISMVCYFIREVYVLFL